MVPPKGRTVRLCYRIAQATEDSEKLRDWFGPANVARLSELNQLAEYVDFLMNH